MRRLLSSGLVVFAGMVSIPIAVAPPGAGEPVVGHREDPREEDPRLAKLKSFFRKADCPAQEYTHVFLEAADQYDLDWRLLPSLSYVESTGGKAARNNNLFGWNSGNAEFASPSAGIREVGYRLANSLLYRDKDLDSLLNTYNPLPEYAQKVKSVMLRISPN